MRISPRKEEASEFPIPCRETEHSPWRVLNVGITKIQREMEGRHRLRQLNRHIRSQSDVCQRIQGRNKKKLVAFERNFESKKAETSQ